MTQITETEDGRVMIEPLMRPDFKCTVPGCRKPLPEAAVANEDPFCSTGCCKEWYGVEIKLKKPGVPVGASA